MTRRVASPAAIAAQKEKISAAKKKLVEGLPHLYGFKWYAWARAFFESRNRMNLLCAANQISKSSTQIRKTIDWATNVRKWPELWPSRTPRVFWYFYPNQDVATTEFEKKWVPEFLPRAEYKDHKVYGWKADMSKGDISAIHFNSGVSVYFHFYSQSALNLQSTTVDAMFVDEEMPVEIYNELLARMFSTDGYFHMVFTATLGQEMWLRAMEGKGDKELFKDAFKQQVTMYDCCYYEDGTPGHYSDEKIERIKSFCSTDAEIQKRVYGRFIADSGRKYPTFSADRHYVKPFGIPHDWRLYAGVDIGSGGKGGQKSHPGAICFVAVRPDFQFGVVYRAWRGDVEATTAGDILNKFIDLRGQEMMTAQVFDQNSRDFGTIASRMGESFEKADKSHEVGEQVINTLFKHDMMMLFDDDAEISKLGGELQSLLKDTPKNKARDDLADAFRYTLTKIPWDFGAIKLNVPRAKEAVPLHEKAASSLTEAEYQELEIMQRRGLAPTRRTFEEGWDEDDEDIDFWNEAYGS